MDRNNPLSRIALAATPRMLKRAALFTGGAVMGLSVSAAASYALVSLFASDSSARLAQIAPTAPARAPSATPHTTLMSPLASVDVAPLPVVLASATVGIADAPVALAPAQIAPQVRTDPAVASIATRPATLSPALDAPADSADVAPVLVTYSAPEITPPARPDAALVANPAALADEIALALPTRAQLAPPARPNTATLNTTDSFAALASGDAAARGGATLFATPETTSSIEEVVVASATNLVTSDAIPSLRPKPRPAEPAELVRVASPAPATAAVPASAPQTEVITPRRVSGQTCGSQLTRAMPRRKGNAASGTQFFSGLTGVGGSDRDALVINELARGNMPDFLHHLVPVTFRGPDARGAQAEITICVTPDYLALGSDGDFVRTPLGLPSAALIAGRFDMTLPTPRMVDAIYAQADVRLKPQPMQAGPQMTSTSYLMQHNASVQAQLAGRHGLVAGQKKDVVMASRMANHPGRVAIYGWHRSGGHPIQPVSTVHQASYADYSHGIRLVSKTAYLNGKPVSLDDLLASGRYAWLINNDGPMPGPVIRTASR